MNIRGAANLRSVAGDLGVEIEVEGRRLPGSVQGTVAFGRMWSIHHDGSLRGEAYEYVLKTPGNLKKIRLALDEVAKSYKKCNSRISNSVRAGVHVHVNCQPLNMLQVMTFATLYYTLEELLLMFCQPSRRGNHFCLRAKDAEFQIFHLQQVLNGRRINNFGDNNMRYSSINFCALPKFGSLEFRSLESGDLDKIYLWAKILLDLRNVSLTYNNPISIIEDMSQDGYENFLMHVLGENYKYFSNIPERDGLVLSGMRHAQDLAYGINWDEINEGWMPRGRRPRAQDDPPRGWVVPEPEPFNIDEFAAIQEEDDDDE